MSDAMKARVRAQVAAYAREELDRKDRLAFDLFTEALARQDDEAASELMFERLMIKRRLAGVPLEG